MNDRYTIPDFLRKPKPFVRAPVERPMLFSLPMVRALLAGTKTQTRRVVKPQPDEHGLNRHGDVWPKNWKWFDSSGLDHRCPYGQPGDRLWVRESHWMDSRDATLAVMSVDGFVVSENGRETGMKANPEELGLNHFWKKRPSIHMPRWASRILLEIVDVRVERLQDISDGDAMREGADQIGDNDGAFRAGYERLWESINGPGSWAENPWVWCIEFKRVTP